MTITLAILVLLSFAVWLFISHPQFGKEPSGARLLRMQQSPNFKEGKFQNVSITPELAEGYTMSKVVYAQFFKKAPRRRPVDRIPSIKTDLLNLAPGKNVLVWFGHSSYFIQIDGRRILVDPVFSGNASPIPGTNASFAGTDSYRVSDLPRIDYLFITHDHYDHLDYQTMVALKHQVATVICGLGVAAHLEHWGYKPEQIIEEDWNEKIDLEGGFVAYTCSARHFSGRGFTRNNTLWMSYVLQTPTAKIYIGGDSGYDSHFEAIGNEHGPIDLAILDNGQYDVAWRFIHMLPDEVLKAAQDLKAKRVLPAHSSKFVMANHPWDEPLSKVTALNQSYGLPLVTPMIGEIVRLDDFDQQFRRWWVDLK